VRARLPRGLAPARADDIRWLEDPALDAALTSLWAGPDERGVVVLWPPELDALAARDLPQGVGVCVRVGAEPGDLGRLLRRGGGEWPLVVEADFGAAREAQATVLDPATYTSLVRAAAEMRRVRAGDVDYGYGGAAGPENVTLRVRLRVQEVRPARAFRAAQEVAAVLRAPAQAAERAARQGIDDVLHLLRA
jgi:hypothetical protein